MCAVTLVNASAESRQEVESLGEALARVYTDAATDDAPGLRFESHVHARKGAALSLDLLPDTSIEAISQRLTPGKQSLSNRLRRVLRDPVKQALVMEFARPLPTDLAPFLKSLPIQLGAPFPMDEAISTAGGLRFEVLTESLELRSHPGVFAAGEMLDWEAPTGGYLLTACLATGLWAGQHAARTLCSSL